MIQLGIRVRPVGTASKIAARAAVPALGSVALCSMAVVVRWPLMGVWTGRAVVACRLSD
jgi:hypothetical protein